MNKQYFTKIVAASILGDGYFYKVDQTNDKANTHFMLKQTEQHQDYVDHMANILSDLTKVRIDKVEPYTDNRGYNIQGQLILKTMRHPTYKKMYNRLYTPVGNTHVKVLDPHYLKLMDWETLAMMYMDDGWIQVTENKTKPNHIMCSIATHCFSYYENKVLRDLFAEKFNVHFNIKPHKQKSGEYLYYLTASGRDNCIRMLDGIEEFVFPSYEYKLKY